MTNPVRMTAPARMTERLSDMTGLTPIRETVAHADPQAVYRKLRAEWGEVAPVELEPGVNAWLVMGYTELVQVLRQERRFPRSPAYWRDYNEGRVRPDSPLGPVMFPQPSALFFDGDEHRRLRAPVDDAVRSLPERQMARVTREACASLIDRFADKGEADLIADYAQVVPTISVGRMLGLDVGKALELSNAAQDIMASEADRSRGGVQRYQEILSGLVAARHAEPADDMTTVFAQHPNFKDDTERIMSMLVAVSSASEKTMAWIASTLLLMLTDRRFSARLSGGLLDIEDTLEEVLWRDPAVANWPARHVMRDTVLGGRAVAAGDVLILGFAAANADPRVHVSDQWNEIGNRAHLAWGAGPHICPAQVPARIVVRTAVETALHRLPGLRLTVDPEQVVRVGPWTRCPASLPVTFIPSGPVRPGPTA